MGHTKATPTHERPTLENLRSQEAWVRHQQTITVEVTGIEWEDTDSVADFSVKITGDKAIDVDETIESLLNNGNLEQLKIDK